MKSTGMVRHVDELGRVVIPKEIRNSFKIDIGDPLEIFTQGKTVVLTKYELTKLRFVNNFFASISAVLPPKSRTNFPPMFRVSKPI